MKFFTLKEANSALVLIRPIIKDITTKWALAKQVKDECEILIETNIINTLNEKEEKIDVLLEEIENHIEELNAIGIEFKGFDEGVIDFPAKITTRLIHLCWKFTDTKVSYWHEIFEGYLERKKISPNLEIELNNINNNLQQKNTILNR